MHFCLSYIILFLFSSNSLSCLFYPVYLSSLLSVFFIACLFVFSVAFLVCYAFSRLFFYLSISFSFYVILSFFCSFVKFLIFGCFCVPFFFLCISSDACFCLCFVISLLDSLCLSIILFCLSCSFSGPPFVFVPFYFYVLFCQFLFGFRLSCVSSVINTFLLVSCLPFFCVLNVFFLVFSFLKYLLF